MNKFKWIFMSNYNRLMYCIVTCLKNKYRLRLDDINLVLDFDDMTISLDGSVKEYIIAPVGTSSRLPTGDTIFAQSEREALLKYINKYDCINDVCFYKSPIDDIMKVCLFDMEDEAVCAQEVRH